MVKRKIDYIEEGIVVDHIPRNKVWKIAEILGVDKRESGRVSLGDGYSSRKMNRDKGVLKIEGIKLTKRQLNSIALLAEDVTVSIIEAGNVHEKIKVKIPNRLEGIVLCPNLICFSNINRENIPSIINYSSKKGFSCYYCSTEFGYEELKFY